MFRCVECNVRTRRYYIMCIFIVGVVIFCGVRMLLYYPQLQRCWELHLGTNLIGLLMHRTTTIAKQPE